MIINLDRIKTSDQGTEGIIYSSNFAFFIIELPWKDNKRDVSCIPDGKYKAVITDSPKYGRVYKLKSVPDRSDILIHYGNWAGDTTKGFISNSQGCLILGKGIGELSGQRAVLKSKAGLKEFMKKLREEDFTLKISWI